MRGAASPAAPSSPLVTRRTGEEDQPPGRVRILIVEDNPVNQKLVVRLVEKLGYRADVVGNGREAVEATERLLYRVILMDCQMPEMDGFEATQVIRARA